SVASDLGSSTDRTLRSWPMTRRRSMELTARCSGRRAGSVPPGWCELSEQRLGPRRNVLRREAEELLQVLVLARLAVALETEHVPPGADPAVPAERARRLDGEACRDQRRQHGVAVLLRL